MTETPLHGGALQSALQEKFPVLKTDSASVYRTLQQLEKNSEVVSEWDTSGKGPAVRIYKLTKAGWDKLDFWKTDIQERIKNLEIFLSSYERVKKKILGRFEYVTLAKNSKRFIQNMTILIIKVRLYIKWLGKLQQKE